MKRFRLSSATERCAITAILVGMILLFSLLIIMMWSSPVKPLLIGSAIFLVLLYGTYVFSVWNAICEIDQVDGKIRVFGLRTITLDISGSHSICTREFEMGSNLSRRILFLDVNGSVIGAFGTFFLARRGVQAEQLANRLAQELHLVFVPSLQTWEYDREARKEHEKQLAEEAKEKRRAEWNALKRKFLHRPVAETPITDTAEELNMEFEPEAVSDGINYDALDDEK